MLPWWCWGFKQSELGAALWGWLHFCGIATSGWLGGWLGRLQPSCGSECAAGAELAREGGCCFLLGSQLVFLTCNQVETWAGTQDFSSPAITHFWYFSDPSTYLHLTFRPLQCAQVALVGNAQAMLAGACQVHLRNKKKVFYHQNMLKKTLELTCLLLGHFGCSFLMFSSLVGHLLSVVRGCNGKKHEPHDKSMSVHPMLGSWKTSLIHIQIGHNYLTNRYST